MFFLRKLLAFAFLATAWPASAFPDETGTFSDDKRPILTESMKWAEALPVERLSALPKPQDDQYRAAVRKLAGFVDGPRDAVDEELKRVGFDVALQGEPWTRLAPVTKVAIAAQKSFAVSQENGEKFLAMLSSSLAKRYPSASVIKEIPAIPYSDGAVLFAETAAEKLPPIAPEFSGIVLRLGSYLSSGGKMTEADLAELTPLSEYEIVKLVASARDATEFLESLLAKSGMRYEAEGGIENAKLAQTQLLASWVKAAEKSYPTIKKDAILAPWLGFDGPLDGPGGLSPSIFPNRPRTPGPSTENGISIAERNSSVSPTNSARTRPIPEAPRDTTGKSFNKKPAAGGIKLDSRLTADSVSIDRMSFEQKQSGEWYVIVEHDEAEAKFETTATALWCGLNFIHPNSSVLERYPDLKSPERFSALVDCTCGSASAEFGIHPVLDHTPLGMDLIRLDVVIFGMANGKQYCPDSLSHGSWKELITKFDIYSWYDDEATVVVKDGKVLIRAKSAPHDELMRIRFWHEKEESNVPLAEAEVELLRKHYKPLGSAEHFAKLVALLRWADQQGKLPEQPSGLMPRVKIFPSRMAYTDLHTQSEVVPAD